MENLVFENKSMRLVVGDDAKAKSLVYKKTGEELLEHGDLSLFTVTQERPYNNENKLIYMNQRTTYHANAITREGDMLTVGFDVAPYRALVEVKVTDDYINFTLRGFDVARDDFYGLRMKTPPAVEFCLCRLALRRRERYGRWLNVTWDKDVAVNLLASCPRTIVDVGEDGGSFVMHATAMKAIKMMDASAALIVSDTDTLLDKIDVVECDFDLPRGVRSRRNPEIQHSIYWVSGCTPSNVDTHIALCKAGGFRMMTLYYPSFYVTNGYGLLGDYDYLPDYPEGEKSITEMLERIKAEGIIPGLHVLPTHIGIWSRYCTPVADRRLRIKEEYRLSRPLGTDETVIYVDENPDEMLLNNNTEWLVERARILQFGGEMISYKGYTTTPPYCFVGCTRGYNNTTVTPHPLGERGGLLDVSEYGAYSVYADQRTDLQDEVNRKIAKLYNCGFRYMYFDGAEGTNEPFGYYVSHAQYDMYRKMEEEPLFCTGAAKTHFGWHMLGGSNAFDVFPADIFKAMIDRFPVHAAEVLSQDFTIVNFGWWKFFSDMRPDIYEYGLSRAAGWSCPDTLQSASMETIKKNPRYADNFEVMRRWHDARERGFFTEERRSLLRSKQEYTLIVNEVGEYEMYPVTEVPLPCAAKTYAYAFERGDRTYATLYLMDFEDAELVLPAPAFPLSYTRDLGGEEITVVAEGDTVRIPVGERRYLSAPVDRATFTAWLSQARI